MQTVQSSALVLYSYLLIQNTVNKYGIANANYTDMTFTNINIKQVLGDNYDKYYKFNLVLNSINAPNAASAVGVNNESAVMFYMSGLPFDTTSSYSTITGTNNNSTFFGTMKFASRGATNANSDVQTFAPQFFNTFLRPTCDFVDISIALRSSVATFTAGVPSFLFPIGVVYPRLAYSFSIFPVLNTALLPFPSQTERSLVDKQRMFR